ncbi:MAG: anaerobic ribonucleoside-triphosphate reductase activating protein [Clostridia bacterium]|nr:anaerobic ribonucleoside-triphosphate reductase activating protein [Clostridia bacterium]
MRISGFQKMTLLDFPGRVAATVFTFGCNLRCPFCHNASLVVGKNDVTFTEDEILTYLNKRQGLLDGVCITGGEPLLQPGIADFIKKIKDLGYAVKLDTNGCYPEKLKELVNAGLVDYVAMDLKNCFEKYAVTVGIENFDTAPIKESVNFLIASGIDFEFRTTIVKELHTVEDIKTLSNEIKGAKKYFLQNFVDSGDIIGEGLSAHDKSVLEQMKAAAEKTLDVVEIRGI